MNVLLSVRPMWASLIALGNKTGEIRKSRPKFETPFRCFLYCASIKSVNLDEYAMLHAMTGGRIDEWHGRVIGEFTCERIDKITPSSFVCKEDADRVLSGSCLSRNELFDYLGWFRFKPIDEVAPCYKWHISDLKVYEEPRPLSDFVCRKPLKRPPQSWCYVEDPAMAKGDDGK